MRAVQRDAGPETQLLRPTDWLLFVALAALLAWSVFDPSSQLFDRDTGRAEYAYKQFIALRLHAGELPLWFPWTGAGHSLLGELTPALFHPLTLLYLALPFELAFKLNHVLAPLLAALGAGLLARRLGGSAAVAGVVYGGAGYVVSMSASIVHYALGAAALPLAVFAVLRWLEGPSRWRLFFAAFALALPVLAGEPQSALFAGAGSLLAALALHGFRKLPRLALAALLALSLSAPALLPGLFQLARSARSAGLSDYERHSFVVRPARLFGLALPWAFDDAPERTDALPAFSAFFASNTGSAFATSIALSLPALLLALFARGRRSALLAALALLFALGSLGGPFETLLHFLLPGQSLFRFPEKLIGPLSLCLALLAALGAQRAFATPRTAGRLALASLAAALLLLAARQPARAALAQNTLLAAVPAAQPSARVDAGMAAHSGAGTAAHSGAGTAAHSGAGTAAHSGAAPDALLSARAGGAVTGLFARLPGEPATNADFLAALARALLAEALLAAMLAFAAAVRWWTPRPPSLDFAAVVCALGAFAASGALFFTAPLELLHGPFALAEALRERAGESAGRFRIDADPDHAISMQGVDHRLGHALFLSQSLAPQFNALARVESVAVYAALTDRDYLDAFHAAPLTMESLFGVRFQLRAPWLASPGFEETLLGAHLREVPAQPRAFVAPCAASLGRDALLARLPAIDPHREVLLPAEAGASGCAQLAGEVSLARPRPERLEASVNIVHIADGQVNAVQASAWLVFADHSDPGWHATLDGAEVPVEPADLAAMAVRLPPGAHRVVLTFFPRGLAAGLVLAALALFAIAFSPRRAIAAS